MKLKFLQVKRRKVGQANPNEEILEVELFKGIDEKMILI